MQIQSASLAKVERKSLSKSAVKLATASVKLGTHMATDYSLYWVLTLISHHARYQSKVQGKLRISAVCHRSNASAQLPGGARHWRRLPGKAPSSDSRRVSAGRY